LSFYFSFKTQAGNPFHFVKPDARNPAGHFVVTGMEPGGQGIIEVKGREYFFEIVLILQNYYDI
jgi:hypothetical protein